MLCLQLTSSSRTPGMRSDPQHPSQPSRACISSLLPTGQGTSKCMAITRLSSASPLSSMLNTCNSISTIACCSTCTNTSSSSSSSISNRYSMLHDNRSMHNVRIHHKCPLLLPPPYTLHRTHQSTCLSIMLTSSSSSSDGMVQCPALMAA